MIEAVIQVKDDHLVWWSMETATKIKSGYKVGTVERKCSCAAFRIRRREACTHLELLDAVGWKWGGLYSISDEVRPIKPDDVGVILSDDKGGRKLVMVPPPDASINAYEILKAIESGESVVALGDVSAKRSYCRWMAEMTEAFNTGQNLTAPTIISLKVPLSGEITLEAWAAGSIDLEPPVAGGTEAKSKPKSKIVEGPWAKIEKPDDFYVSDDVWEALLYAGSSGGRVLLLGPTGSGKSELAYRAAKSLGIQIEPFNFGAMQEPRISLIGNTHFNKETGTLFKKSRFISAIEKESMIVLLDEVSRSNRDAANILLPLLDSQGYMSLDEAEDSAVIYRGKSVAFFATANVGYEYTGTDALDRAFMDRFEFKIELDYPPVDAELKIASQRYPKSPKVILRKIVETANQQREMAKAGDFETTISTRMVLDAVRAISMGVNPKTAVKHVIMGCFPSEGGGESERIKLLTLFQKRAAELV